jgi:hypothetical protein
MLNGAVVFADPHRFSSAEIRRIALGAIEFAPWIDAQSARTFVGDRAFRVVVLDQSIAPSAKRSLVELLLPQSHDSPHAAILVVGYSSEFAAGDLEPGCFFDNAPDAETLRTIAEWGLCHFGSFAEVLIGIDPSSTPLMRDASCEWVKTALGIVGVVAIGGSPQAALDLVHRSVSHAYAQLDRLPEADLSFEDLWNILLFISVAWPEKETRGHSPAHDLIAFANDMTGSRKILLWQGDSPLQHIASFQPGTTAWTPVSGDPLWDAINTVARDNSEAEALSLLFKKRISQQDLDQIIEALSRTEPL